MIKVDLIAKTDVNPTVLSSHAAKVCYTAAVPELGELIDVENRLFKTGHHSTLQHNYFTFSLQNLSLASVYFGLFLYAPFYGGSQRSGRFSKMYQNPNPGEIRNYLKHFYPSEPLDNAMKFIEKGLKIYADNIERVTEITKEVLKQERPFADEKYIAVNAGKIAQEQLRFFISESAPTALDYSINLSSLCALYRVAWSPEMREITDKMAAAVLEHYPDIAYMFEKDKRIGEDWSLAHDFTTARVTYKPSLEILDVDINEKTFNIYKGAKDVVDVLAFSPLCMDNSINHIKLNIELSAIIMGHDQRHRTIKRGNRTMTGAFYLAPLLKEAGLEEQAKEYMQDFIDLSKEVSPSLLTVLLPQGAVVKYDKMADLNALIHEQGKRTCWCAQEEIYHLSTTLRKKLQDKGVYPELIEQLSPPCYRLGKCTEGTRYCGRDIREDKKNYFKDRKA